MKSRIIQIVTVVLLSGSVYAQDTIFDETFSKISIIGNAKVVLSQTNETPFVIYGNAARLQIKNNQLNIDGNAGTVNISIRELSAIKIHGRGVVVANTPLNSDKLQIDISGSGKVTMDSLNAGEVETDISGSGNVVLSGKAANLIVDISGSGKVEALNLGTNTVEINISGSGRVTTDVLQELNVNMSGIGSVSYQGNPVSVQKQISGVGKITRIESQSDSGSEDSLFIGAGNKKIVITEDSTHVKSNVKSYRKSKLTGPHWAGFELGFNQWFAEPFSSDLPRGNDYLELNSGKSIAVNLNLVDYGLKIYKRNLMLVTGIGVTWNNWRFQNAVTLFPNQPALTGVMDTLPMKKSKLTVSYVTLPLLLEFNSSEQASKSFHIAAGVIGGYRIGTHTKRVLEDNGKSKKVKEYDDFSFNTFRFDSTVRIGYRGFTLFGSYGLMSLFKSREGPDLSPFTVGIALAGW
ncbi:MAG: DUF2807 domain-containing protein [Bacteroidia bacterium]|nr:DUF2807 domain-containing protein [Bacteroidia bacterium]MCZ2276821.1 DUF2807 domain-containing protein [Bacteroidia bacterium]